MTSETQLQPVIGLEIHAQLLTRSKMFCSCSAAYFGADPNTHVCAVCGGMPGALPVINRKAVEGAIMTALALHCEIPGDSKFDRKNYSYPDLPKGYQITQYDAPVGRNGSIEYEVDGKRTRCGIVRVHLEEDTGKSIHVMEAGREVSLIDYNRSGVPLMEIVSAPELASPEAARAFFETVRRILVYLGVSDGNLQEGSLRADVNVSLREMDGEFGTKVEIKNLNSFRAVKLALEYEIDRQRAMCAAGEPLEQETRGWSESSGTTVPQRSKEFAHDYRYFPEPDLPPVVLESSYIEAIRRAFPELPDALATRLRSDYEIPAGLAAVLVDERPRADFFESVVVANPDLSPALVANWVTGELLRLVNEHGVDPADSSVTPARLGALLRLVGSGSVSSTAGKRILDLMFESQEEPEAIARREDLMQVSDDEQLARWVDEVLAGNPDLVDLYRAGKNVLDPLVGKAMQASAGKANPSKAKEILRARLQRV